MTLNYHPTPWQRIGGPWAITLRAYLWTAPIAVFGQPIIEPGFISGNENRFVWLAVCLIGYLTVGACLLFSDKFLIPNREVKAASVAMLVFVAVFCGTVRSFVVGALIPTLGLTGIGPIERIPFSATVSVFWLISSALIMDAKYRYRRQLDELAAEQISLLVSQRAYLSKFANTIPMGTKADFEKSYLKLQNLFRNLAGKPISSESQWVLVARQAYQTVMNLISVERRTPHFSELAESEFIATRKDAFKVISQTPLFSIPVVFSFHFTTVFLAAARIFPISEVAPSLTIGLLVNLLILVIGKKLIQRSERPSAFGYINMFIVLALLAIIGPTFSSADYISVTQIQVFALASTAFEITWIVTTGLLELSQINRQKIIDQAIMENNLLRLEIQYWETIAQRSAAENYSPSFTLDLVTSDLRQFLDSDQPEKCQGAIECARSLATEIKFIRNTIDDFSIESEFERILLGWGQEANILWTVQGVGGSEVVLRRAIAAIEVSILRSIHYCRATVISVEVTIGERATEITITDNGSEFADLDAALGSAILENMSSNTWKLERTGGVNKVSAQIS